MISLLYDFAIASATWKVDLFQWDYSCVNTSCFVGCGVILSNAETWASAKGINTVSVCAGIIIAITVKNKADRSTERLRLYDLTYWFGRTYHRSWASKRVDYSIFATARNIQLNAVRLFSIDESDTNSVFWTLISLPLWKSRKNVCRSITNWTTELIHDSHTNKRCIYLASIKAFVLKVIGWESSTCVRVTDTKSHIVRSNSSLITHHSFRAIKICNASIWNITLTINRFLIAHSVFRT